MKKILFLFIIGLIELLLFTTVTIYLFFAREIKGKESVMNRHNSGVVLLDRKNRVFFSFYSPKQADVIPLSQIPQSVQQAVIASEDKEFYSHPGFSIRGILRAVYVDTLAKERIYGGSTITQQLVKNAILTPKKSFLRKYEELVLAIELERRFSKRDILEMYLNSAYFGEGAFGIENAAEIYFGKRAKDLTTAESALLVGLIPEPSRLSPLSNGIEKAKQHQAIVLQEMVQDRYMSPQFADVVANQKILFHPKKEEANTIGIHYAIMVKDMLVKKYGEEYIARSGFTVKTALDLDWQKFAEQAVQDQVKNLQYDNVSNGAAVVIDPKTGEIKAMVGSVDWYNKKFGKVNIATTPRQSGSAFKPIVYAAAFEKRILTPASVLHDQPTNFANKYHPLDYDKKFRGPVLVRRALANSLNIPAVEVMTKLGVPAVLSAAEQFGITTLGNDPSQYGPSLVLGTGEVSLVELTNAYASFANNGQNYPPTAILEIKNKFNQTIYAYKPQAKTVVSPNAAFLISSILSDNNARAEEFGSALTISRTAAVKTGTAEDFRNALTVGYTPSLAVGVWLGNNDNSSMDNIAGSLGPAPIWKRLMEKFLSSVPVETFTPPPGVTAEYICRERGLRVTQATSSATKEYFLTGTQPTQDCYGSSFTSSISQNGSWSPQPTDTPIPTFSQ